MVLRVPPVNGIPSPLDGTRAWVGHAEEWGAHVRAEAAATGRYRAAWDEMEPLGTNGVHHAPPPLPPAPAPAVTAAPDQFHRPEVLDTGFDVQAKEQGYSGNVCGKCGGSRLKRTGACETCEDCFESGCS